MANHQRYAATKSPEDKFPKISFPVSPSSMPNAAIKLGQIKNTEKLSTNLRLSDIFSAILE